MDLWCMQQPEGSSRISPRRPPVDNNVWWNFKVAITQRSDNDWLRRRYRSNYRGTRYYEIEVLTNEAIFEIRSWVEEASVTLAEHKTKLVLITKWRKQTSIKIRIGEHIIQSPPKLKYLGVMVDQRLKIPPWKFGNQGFRSGYIVGKNVTKYKWSYAKPSAPDLDSC